MTVYIEYAFLENFLLDGALLWLSLRAVKAPVVWRNVFFSAAIGALFAVAFPLLRLPIWLGDALKIAVGALLPLLAFGRVRTKKEWGRYALSATFFFVFTFFFGGALTGALQNVPQPIPQGVVTVGFALLAAFTVFFIEKIYKKRAIYRKIVPCTVQIGEKKVKTQAFLDSGNMATKGGLPVCFLAAELLYELCGERLLFGEEEGQVCDEIAITTLAGEKKLSLYKGFLEVYLEREGEKYEVYFARSANMIGREYKVIIGDRLCVF